MSARLGLSFPLEGVPLSQHREWVAELTDLGYTDLWAGESTNADAFAVLAMAAERTTTLRLGTGIVPVATRAPGLLALSVATLADLAPGRFAFGLGASSPGVVTRWSGGTYDRPFQRTRDTLRFLRRALTGERLAEAFETFQVDGFRLPHVPAQPPPLLLAALRPRMLALAGAEADGVVMTWVSEDDVRSVLPHLGTPAPDFEVVTWVTVCVSADADRARAVARRLVTNYLAVPAYAAAQEWLGRGERLAEFWKLSAAGDRRGAAAAVPDDVIDELVVHGSPGLCLDRLAAFRDAGVTTPVLTLLNLEGDPRDAARAFAEL